MESWCNGGCTHDFTGAEGEEVVNQLIYRDLSGAFMWQWVKKGYLKTLLVKGNID